MVSREKFGEYLSQLISEEETKSLNRKVFAMTVASVICLFVAMTFVFLAMLSVEQNVYFIFFAILFAFTSLILILSRKTGAINKLENKYKGQVVAYLLQDVNYEYIPDSKVPVSVFREARLTRSFDDYSGEDLIIINIPNDDDTLSNSNLVISDVLATKQEYDNNTEEWKTVTKYQGVLGYIRFPFNFKCRLTINRNDYAFLEGLDNVELESIDFNKKFKIRSSDQLEARYILTTDMMTKLLEIHAKESNFQLVLDGDSMYVTIPHKNLLHVKSRSKRVGGDVFYSFYDDLSILLGIIKEIKDNDKIFKM